MSKIILLTHSGGFYTIDRVMERLKDLGHHPIRLNPDFYPQNIQLAFSCNNQILASRLYLNGQVLPLDETESVWSRRLWPFPPASCNPQYQVQC